MNNAGLHLLRRILFSVNITIVCCAAGAFGFKEIGGDLPARLTAAEGPYLATSDVYVPTGRSTTIDAGTVILFRNFTGLKSQGTLIVKGTMQKPVVLSSEFDTTYNPGGGMRPNPFDWNGLYIDKDAVGTDLQNLRVVYSVYGMHAMTKFIRITNSTFAYNGRGNCSIEGNEMPVSAGEPFNYSLTIKDALAAGVPIRILRDPEAMKRNLVRWGGCALFVAGATLGGYYTNQYMVSSDRLKALSSTNRDNLVNHSSGEWNTAYNRKNTTLGVMSGGYLAGVLGTVCFFWSFKF
jgi:hypothetical protein